jgi:hypothetical protein
MFHSLLGSDQLPTDFYRKFLKVYQVWLEIRSAIDSKIEHILDSSRTLPADQSNVDGLRASIEEKDVNAPIAMKRLCPICFAPGREAAHICFDGNFQLKTLGTKREKREGLSSRDSRDKRLFVAATKELATDIQHNVVSY